MKSLSKKIAALSVFLVGIVAFVLFRIGVFDPSVETEKGSIPLSPNGSLITSSPVDSTQSEPNDTSKLISVDTFYIDEMMVGSKSGYVFHSEDFELEQGERLDSVLKEFDKEKSVHPFTQEPVEDFELTNPVPMMGGSKSIRVHDPRKKKMLYDALLDSIKKKTP